MPKKTQAKKPAKSLTGGQSFRQRLNLRKIIIAALLVVVVAAVGLAGWSLYNSNIKPYNQAVVKVDNVTFNMRYYVNTIKNYYGTLPSYALADYSSYGDSEIEQLAGYVETKIGQDYIIKQGSLALGIQIDPDLIKAQLRNSGTPVTRERIDSLMAQELIKKQLPVNQPQVHVQTMLLESENAAQAAVTRLETGEAFDQVAAEVSKLSIEEISNGDLGWMTAREIDLTVGSTQFGELVFSANVGALSGPVYDDTVSKKFGYWVLKSVEITAATDNESGKVHIQGLLLGNEEESKTVLDKLNGGADINDLAKELSQYSGAKDNGAELGWMIQGQDAGDFSPLLSLPVNTVYGPVSDNQTETLGGFWVFNVLEKNDNLALTDEQQLLLEKDLFDRFTAELQKDPNYNVESLLTPEMTDFALNEVVASLGAGSVIIHTASLPDGESGLTYSYQLEIYGNQKGNTWSITSGSLPEGLSLDKSTGLISGVPVNSGLSSFTVEVNSGPHYWQQALTLRLHFPLSVATSSLPDGQVGVDYSVLLAALGENTSYTWSIITGSLPDGMSLDELSGEIYGAPVSAGIYTITVQVDDGQNQATRTLSLSVK